MCTLYHSLENHTRTLDYRVQEIYELCHLKKRLNHSRILKLEHHTLEHRYIPVLPLGLLGVMHAPMPFLIGCHSSVLHIAEVPHDAVIVSLDSNKIDLQIHKGT